MFLCLILFSYCYNDFDPVIQSPANFTILAGYSVDNISFCRN